MSQKYMTYKSVVNISWSIHYSNAIMDTMASQINSLAIVHPTVYSGADLVKHQSSVLLTLCAGHRSPVNSPHKGPVRRNVFPFDDVMFLIPPNVRTIKCIVASWWKKYIPRILHMVVLLCFIVVNYWSFYSYPSRLLNIVTSEQTQWWCLKAAASRLFAQSFVQAQVIEIVKAQRHRICEGNPTVTSGFHYKGPVSRKKFPFDGVIVFTGNGTDYHVPMKRTWRLCVSYSYACDKNW